MEEYITKKLPRRINGRLRLLQARYQIKQKKRISEGRLVEMLVDYALRNEKKVLGGKKGNISSIFGLYTTREKVNSVREIDSVVYGV